MTSPEASIPHFRYFPSAYEDDVFDRIDRACGGCDRPRGLLFTGAVYGEDLPANVEFCPWCIAAGRVGDVGGFLNEVEARVEDAEEVEVRTPGIASWQDQVWPVHHGRPCIFLGVVGFAELKALGDDAVAAMTAEILTWPEWDTDDANAFVESLEREGQPTGYVWRCRECAVPTCRADFT